MHHLIATVVRNKTSRSHKLLQKRLKLSRRHPKTCRPRSVPTLLSGGEIFPLYTIFATGGYVHFSRLQLSRQTFLIKLLSSVFAANSCNGRCDLFWFVHFTSEHSASSCHLFVMRPVCEELSSMTHFSLFCSDLTFFSPDTGSDARVLGVCWYSGRKLYFL